MPFGEATAGTLDRVRDTGRLTLGYRADARPFSYRDESGNPTGYSVALCSRIAEQVKTELGLSTVAVEWVPVTLEDRFRAVQEGKIDLLCGAASTSLSRMKEVVVLDPDLPGRHRGASACGRFSPGCATSCRQEPPSGPFWRAHPARVLEGKTFSVVAGTTSERWLAGRLDTFQLTAKVVPVDELRGRRAAGAEPQLRRLFRRTRHPSGYREARARRRATRPSSIASSRYEPMALAFARGDEDFRLLVDGALSRLFGSEEFGDFYAKWFGTPDQDARTFFRWNALPE